MNVKHLLAMLTVATTVGCNPIQRSSYDSYDDYPVYEGKWEEMIYSKAETRFSLWAPTAQEVRVLLYEQGKGGAAYRMIGMERASDGMWQAVVNGDLKGRFYTFNVKIDDVWQGEILPESWQRLWE